MSRVLTVRAASTALLLLAVAASPVAAQLPGGSRLPSWAASIQAILARPGEMYPADVFRIGITRSDVQTVHERVVPDPNLQFTSWQAYRKVGKGDEVMVMGDIILLPSEVDAAIRRLIKGRMQITALHNHLAGETPELVSLHYQGTGPAADLAVTLKEALALTGTPRYQPTSELLDPEPAAPETRAAFQQVQQILGQEGRLVRNLLEISFARAEPVRIGTAEIPPAMGLMTTLSFQPGEKGSLVTSGCFVLVDDEVTPVVQSLSLGGLSVDAIHNSMANERPSLKFLHFWGEGPAEKLATALRAALDQAAMNRQPRP